MQTLALSGSGKRMMLILKQREIEVCANNNFILSCHADAICYPLWEKVQFHTKLRNHIFSTKWTHILYCIQRGRPHFRSISYTRKCAQPSANAIPRNSMLTVDKC